MNKLLMFCQRCDRLFFCEQRDCRSCGSHLSECFPPGPEELSPAAQAKETPAKAPPVATWCVVCKETLPKHDDFCVIGRLEKRVGKAETELAETKNRRTCCMQSELQVDRLRRLLRSVVECALKGLPNADSVESAAATGVADGSVLGSRGD